MPAIATATQNVYPPRVQVSVTGLTIGDAVELYREVDSERTPLRGGSYASVTDTSLVIIDAELPYGVAVTYVAVVDGVDTYTAGPTVYTLTGGQVAVSDAINGLAAEVVIWDWPDKAFPREGVAFNIGGRNVSVLGPLGQAESAVELLTETAQQAQALETLLRNATSGTVLIREPGGYGDISAYLAVHGVARQRIRLTRATPGPRGTNQARIWVLNVRENDGWAPQLLARGFTLQDIANAYPTPLDLADLAADYATLLAIAQEDWS